MQNYEHGGNIYTKKIKLDFSVNTNPLGMSKKVKKVLTSNVDLYENYPDVNCTKLVNSISNYEKISKKNIVCGNGAADLIYKIVLTVDPKKALLLSPTFSEYEKALKIVKCNIKYFELKEKEDFILSEKILDELDESLDVFFLCNPNNPTGKLVEFSLIEKIIEKCQEKNIKIIIDECFMDLVKFSENYTSKKYLHNKNLIILKAFTKTFAMAGLRLGYIMCNDEDFLIKVKNNGQCWNVSIPAQICGVEALKKSNYIKKSIKTIEEERKYIEKKFKKMGIKFFKSNANYILFKTNLNIEKKLLAKKILIRNCGNYIGLSKEFYRIAIKTHDENIILINEINKIYKNSIKIDIVL